MPTKTDIFTFLDNARESAARAGDGNAAAVVGRAIRDLRHVDALHFLDADERADIEAGDRERRARDEDLPELDDATRAVLANRNEAENGAPLFDAPHRPQESAYIETPPRGAPMSNPISRAPGQLPDSADNLVDATKVAPVLNTTETMKKQREDQVGYGKLPAEVRDNPDVEIGNDPTAVAAIQRRDENERLRRENATARYDNETEARWRREEAEAKSRREDNDTDGRPLVGKAIPDESFTSNR